MKSSINRNNSPSTVGKSDSNNNDNNSNSNNNANPSRCVSYESTVADQAVIQNQTLSPPPPYHPTIQYKYPGGIFAYKKGAYFASYLCTRASPLALVLFCPIAQLNQVIY